MAEPQPEPQRPSAPQEPTVTGEPTMARTADDEPTATREPAGTQEPTAAEPPTTDPIPAEPPWPIASPLADVIVTDDPPSPVSRRPDVLTLLVAALTLAMSVAAFVGVVPDLTGFDPRWMLAAGAAALGALLLASGLRTRRPSR